MSEAGRLGDSSLRYDEVELEEDDDKQEGARPFPDVELHGVFGGDTTLSYVGGSGHRCKAQSIYSRKELGGRYGVLQISRVSEVEIQEGVTTPTDSLSVLALLQGRGRNRS